MSQRCIIHSFINSTKQEPILINSILLPAGGLNREREREEGCFCCAIGHNRGWRRGRGYRMEERERTEGGGEERGGRRGEGEEERERRGGRGEG